MNYTAATCPPSTMADFGRRGSGVSNTFYLFIHPKGRGIKPSSASGGLNVK
ncbi:MAG: hypothetical protein HY800_01320 [Ignavibacteriales bacterium]|nr:hypothetical protein [Ignavibacteriales bacterium]